MNELLQEKLSANEADRVSRWLDGLSTFQHAEATGYLFGYLKDHDDPQLPENLDEILVVSMPPEARRNRRGA